MAHMFLDVESALTLVVFGNDFEVTLSNFLIKSIAPDISPIGCQLINRFLFIFIVEQSIFTLGLESRASWEAIYTAMNSNLEDLFLGISCTRVIIHSFLKMKA